MFDAPVVVHLSRLVTDLGKQSQTGGDAVEEEEEEEEKKVWCDDEDTKVPHDNVHR
jgi:hypothetical protein